MKESIAIRSVYTMQCAVCNSPLIADNNVIFNSLSKETLIEVAQTHDWFVHYDVAMCPTCIKELDCK